MKYDSYNQDGKEVVEITLEKQEQEELAFDGVTSLNTENGTVVIQRENK